MPGPILEMDRVTKRFPGVTALNNMAMGVYEGEVLCLVGENGAGKSTLIKMLSGVYQPDEGEIRIFGKPVTINSPHVALKLGIATVYQENKLIPNLSTAENIFFGRFPHLNGLPFLIDYKKLWQDTKDIFAVLGIHLSPTQEVSTLSASQCQMVEIAKAYSVGARITILDEPSAAITDNELEKLFNVIRRLKKDGKTFIYISHRLKEIFEIGDRVVVLKDGQLVTIKKIEEVTFNQLISLMVGRELGAAFPQKDRKIGSELIRVSNMSNDRVRECSFVLNAGEIVALAGLVGSGRTEIVESLFGRRAMRSGSISIKGERVRIQAPRDAIQRKIGFITEDRKSTGLILNKSVSTNITLPILKRISVFGFLRLKRERQIVDTMVKTLDIKTPSIFTEAQYLSGGTQQKVVLSKWLVTDSQVLIFDEPTKGIDVATKQEFYRLLDQLARDGLGILLISSELPEVIGLANRVYVIREGRLVKEISENDLSEEEIAKYAIGGLN